MKNLFIITLFLSLCSCASLLGNVVEKPKVDLDHVAIKDANLKGATLMFVVNVENPNQMDLKVDQINYKIFVNNKEISNAKTEEAVNVPGKSKAQVKIPLPIEYTKIFSDLKEVLFSNSATYKIEGDAKFPLFSVPFAKEGNLKLR